MQSILFSKLYFYLFILWVINWQIYSTVGTWLHLRRQLSTIYDNNIDMCVCVCAEKNRKIIFCMYNRFFILLPASCKLHSLYIINDFSTHSRENVYVELENNNQGLLSINHYFLV